MLSRIMVSLPSVENREMILKTLLSKEKHDENLDFKELATMTEGFSGSDLKVKFFDRLISFIVFYMIKLISNFM
jgi:ATP-dependent Zn protease